MNLKQEADKAVDAVNKLPRWRFAAYVAGAAVIAVIAILVMIFY